MKPAGTTIASMRKKEKNKRGAYNILNSLNHGHGFIFLSTLAPL